MRCAGHMATSDTHHAAEAFLIRKAWLGTRRKGVAHGARGRRVGSGGRRLDSS